jgi:hypothetical protein
VQTGFTIGVLPGIAQRLVDGRFALPQRPAFRRLVADLAKAAVLAAPAHGAISVGDFQRRAVKIGSKPVEFTFPIMNMVIKSCHRILVYL